MKSKSKKRFQRIRRDQEDFWHRLKLAILKKTPAGFVSLEKLY